MAFDNSIALAEMFVGVLDEKYKMESVTDFLDAPDEIVQGTATADTVQLPQIDPEGLGDYSRNAGFEKGESDVTWEAYKLTMDRGRQFQIDNYDDQETIETAFGQLADEFMRLHVVPEIDAYRFQEMADNAGETEEDDLSKNDVIEAIDEADAHLTDKEVPMEGRVIWVNPTVYKYLKQDDMLERMVDTQTGEEVVDRRFWDLDGNTLVVVPSGRFNTSFDFKDGDDNEGGFDADGDEINFLMAHPTAVLPIVKHNDPRVFDPETNQSANAWLFDYRLYHDCFVLDNKEDAIYVHKENGDA